MQRGWVGPGLAWIAAGLLLFVFLGDSGPEATGTVGGSPPVTPNRSELAPVPLPPEQLPQPMQADALPPEAHQTPETPEAPEASALWSDLGARRLPGEDRPTPNQPPQGTFTHLRLDVTVLRARGTFARVAQGNCRVHVEVRKVETQERVLFLRAQLNDEAELNFLWQSYRKPLPAGRYDVLLTLPMDLQREPVRKALQQRYGYPAEGRICLARNTSAL